MSSPWIASLRSVALDVPDLARAEQFYTETWRLSVSARSTDALYLRGSGPDHHLLALHASDATRLRHISLRARSAAALAEIAAKVPAAKGRVLCEIAPASDPAGGHRLLLCDAQGRRFEIVHGDALHASQADAEMAGDHGAGAKAATARTSADQPQRLAHAVLNSRDVPAAQRFLEQALGFHLIDRTRIMAFMNCSADHHSLAYADADNDALNHIAFLMPDLDAVMRGGGRMKDAGFPIEWGPGRHGPGHNAFNYFLGPFGEAIEYTAEVQQVDASYRVGQPADWAWPAGRVDHWGISAAPSARLKAAQRALLFMPSE